MKENDQIPHAIALWMRWEIHERRADGMLTGNPKDFKEFSGIIPCDDKQHGNDLIERIMKILKDEVENKSR